MFPPLLDSVASANLMAPFPPDALALKAMSNAPPWVVIEKPRPVIQPSAFTVKDSGDADVDRSCAPLKSTSDCDSNTTLVPVSNA